MPFLSPWSFLWGLSLLGILLLYFLKQKHQEQVVPSTLLWARAMRELEASKPWQKLRRNLLMFLQLLLALLFTLALARPYTPAPTQGEWILVIDGSASMQATDVAPSRFEYAIEQARAMADGLAAGEPMTVIAASSKVEVVISRSSDKAAIKTALRGMSATNGESSLEEALSLALALKREMPDAHVALLSDRSISTGEELTFINCAGDGENVAVEPIRYTRRGDTLTALSNITNYGQSILITLGLYADGTLIDAKEIETGGYDTTPVYWDGIPNDVSVIEVRIEEGGGALIGDDSAWAAVSPYEEIRVLYAGPGNRFLETALLLREDILLEKTSSAALAADNGYDLYIYDRVLLPEKLPQDGNVFIIKPETSDGELIGELKGMLSDSGVSGRMRAAPLYESHPLLSYVDLAAVSVGSADIYAAEGFDAIGLIGEPPVLQEGRLGTCRVLLLGFDIHSSDWPLRKDFPIFIQNIVEWAAPQAVNAPNGVFAGGSVTLNLLPAASGAEVIMPSGKRAELSQTSVTAAFDELNELGVYTLAQRVGNEVVTSSFAVHIPRGESDLRFLEGEADPEAAEPGKAPVGTREYAIFALLLALIIMLVEWGVYCRGR